MSTVGFIGLGRMGQGMARRILDGRHDLAVYDVAPAATEAFGSAGQAGRISVIAVERMAERYKRGELAAVVR